MKTFEFIQDINAADERTLSLVQNYTTALVEKYQFTVAQQYVAGVYRTLFKVIAIALKNIATKKSKKVSFRFNDDHGNMIFGATLNFIEGEEAEDAGNWVLAYTFDPADLEESDNIISNQQDMFVALCQSEVYSDMFGNFAEPEGMNRMYEQCIESLKEFLDANSEDGEEVQLEMQGIFTATVGFEGGERVYSVVPGAQIKQIIKNDDSLTE